MYKFFHTLHPTHWEIHWHSVYIQKMTSFLHLFPSPSHHKVSSIWLQYHSTWVPDFILFLQQLNRLFPSWQHESSKRQDGSLLLCFLPNSSPPFIPLLYIPHYCDSGFLNIPKTFLDILILYNCNGISSSLLLFYHLQVFIQIFPFRKACSDSLMKFQPLILSQSSHHSLYHIFRLTYYICYLLSIFPNYLHKGGIYKFLYILFTDISQVYA